MENKQIDNLKLPVLGFGTWRVGGKKQADTSLDVQNIKVIQAAIKLGLTHIDTAEVYGAGHAEEVVGKAIKDFDRQKLFITTKVAPDNLKYQDVINAAQASLKRLDTDYLDLYLIHAPNPTISLEETMKAMDYLVEQGLTKFIGVSNFSVAEMKEAQSFAKSKIIANQIEYSLTVRNKGDWLDNMEKEVIPYCQKHEIMVIAFRSLHPIVKGKLNNKQESILNDIAEKYHKSSSQVALNWVISKKNVVTLVQTSDPEHLEQNLEAVGWQLEQNDIEKLDKI